MGPVEHDEEVVDRQTVERYLPTHRASRHFRNYWHYNPSGFKEFADMIRETWPGMDIKPPERSEDGKKFFMFCEEDRITRELQWIGFGFQAWCQLLTHITRNRGATILVIDEPDIYLHPDLQRQLLSILRELGPDILIATHSTEIMGESEPTDIVVVDKHQKSAARVRGAEGVQDAMDVVGSVHSLALTQLARVRRVLYVEGDDFRLLKLFAGRIGLPEFAAGRDMVPFPLGGFPPPGYVKAVCLGIKRTVGRPLLFAGVFDRDFRCEEELAALRGELAHELWLREVLDRKEIENYLLVPTVLDRALAIALADHSRRTGAATTAPEPILSILERLTGPLKVDLQSQYVAKRTDFLRLQRSAKDHATIVKETTETFENRWRHIETRMEVVGGKRILADLVRHVQDTYHVTLTRSKIVSAFRGKDIPSDLMALLRRLDQFRTANLP